VLGEDELAVDGDVEDAAPALLQDGLHPHLPLDFGRQTGGPREVVSGYAVLDGDAHRVLHRLGRADFAADFPTITRLRLLYSHVHRGLTSRQHAVEHP
jgi:hypothetical protein